MPPPIVPQGNNAAITYFEQHLAPWVANQANIGISIQQAGDITLATQTARNTFDAAGVARNDSKVATETMGLALADMRAQGAAIIKTVRAFAESTNDPTVFQLAVIPTPAPGNPLPPPATPTNFSGLLNGDGHVELKWSGDIEGRMFFTIMRQVTPVTGTIGSWDLIGSVPDPFLIDTKVPSSAVSVSYRIAARRGPNQSIFTDPVSVLLATPGIAAA